VAPHFLDCDDGVLWSDVVDMLSSVGAPPTAILKVKSARVSASSNASAGSHTSQVSISVKTESYKVHSGDRVSLCRAFRTSCAIGHNFAVLCW
jgi:hypothetical protein